MGWIEWQVYLEWEAQLPNRYDPQRAAEDEVDNRGYIDYENSYAMHHKVVEATAHEIKDLIARQRAARNALGEA